MDLRFMGHEVAKAIQRERQMAGAARNWKSGETDLVERYREAIGARNRLGRALVRAGRYLLRGTAPRPEPIRT